jgi:diadenosine tetraphosphatase ApaH/serine/threonine PP2A family protein phosphatase
MFPEHIHLLRGNHENNQMTEYSFYDEVLQKYSKSIYDLCQNVFDQLPIAAVVNNEYFCVHGGIGDNTPLITELEKMNKYEKEGNEVITNLLWSDPKQMETYFQPNQRGSGYYFNEKALEKF